MIKKIANLSIKQKLFLIVLFPNIISLLIVSFLLLVLEIDEFKPVLGNDYCKFVSGPKNFINGQLLEQFLCSAEEVKDLVCRETKVGKSEIEFILRSINKVIE